MGTQLTRTITAANNANSHLDTQPATLSAVYPLFACTVSTCCDWHDRPERVSRLMRRNDGADGQADHNEIVRGGV